MKKYSVFYWSRRGDEKDLHEKLIEADSLDEALFKFRTKDLLSKINSIEFVTNKN